MKYLWILLIVGCGMDTAAPTLPQGTFTGEYDSGLTLENSPTVHEATMQVSGDYLILESNNPYCPRYIEGAYTMKGDILTVGVFDFKMKGNLELKWHSQTWSFSTSLIPG